MDKLSGLEYFTWIATHHRIFFGQVSAIRKDYISQKITEETYHKRIDDLLEKSIKQYTNFVLDNA